jgi:hypothetical protein
VTGIAETAGTGKESYRTAHSPDEVVADNARLGVFVILIPLVTSAA